MTEPALKKRKRDPEDTYVFSPFKIGTLKEDLDDVPELILKDALLAMIQKDPKLLTELNTAIPTAMSNWKKKSSEVEILDEKPADKKLDGTDLRSSLGLPEITAPLVTRYKIHEKIDIDKLRDVIKEAFSSNKWFSEREKYSYRRRTSYKRYRGYYDDSDDESDDDSDDEGMYDSDEDNERMQNNYQTLIELLNEKREEAIVTFNAGNRAKGYLIFKTLSEEATKDVFDRNGDIEEISANPDPEEWIKVTSALLSDCAAKLTEGDLTSVKAMLEKPEQQQYSGENNFFVLSNFPYNRQEVERNFFGCFYKALTYIGKFTITTATKVEGDCTTFLVNASVPAVSMSGRYSETITFDATRVIKYTCSCPVGNHCKHSAALQAQIAQEKDQLLRVMRQSAMYTT